jgi:hypothetical protein
VPARALLAGVPYEAFMDGTNVGTLIFVLESTTLGVACRYSVEWVLTGGSTSSQCYLDESVAVGREDCASNALGPMSGLVQLAPGQDCDGFNTSGQQTSFFVVMLGERAADGSLDGLIQASAADPYFDAFRAVPVQ